MFNGIFIQNVHICDHFTRQQNKLHIKRHMQLQVRQDMIQRYAFSECIVTYIKVLINFQKESESIFNGQ